MAAALFKIDDSVTSTQHAGIGRVRDVILETVEGGASESWRYMVEFSPSVFNQAEAVLTISAGPPTPAPSPVVTPTNAVLFDHENRILAQEGLPPLTIGAFLTSKKL
jgi:hypothetical protein